MDKTLDLRATAGRRTEAEPKPRRRLARALAGPRQLLSRLRDAALVLVLWAAGWAAVILAIRALASTF